MSWSALDDDTPIPAAPSRAWNASGAPPTRELDAVLADAEPDRVQGVYRWHRSGPDWWGVDPPRGVLPQEVCDLIEHVYQSLCFCTPGGAKALLYCVVKLVEQGQLKLKSE